MASASDGGKVSPEVEFGTFLRLPHQSRTFSRPADSYIPSSPPSRPTSPTPASPPPSTVFLHGRPAPAVSKMRQGAPRLGGLGLGGIVEPSAPSAPPPLPARRPQHSSTSGSPQRASLPPAIPPASRNAASSRSASPAPARPQTPNSTNLDSAGTGNLPQRPFLSPEMDKPTVREGAFALDRPKVENVLKPSNEMDEEAQVGAEEEKRDTRSNGVAEVERNGIDQDSTEAKEAASPEAFPSPEVGEDENGGMFDRFKSTLSDGELEEKDLSTPHGDKAEEDGGRESDRASIDSTGESFFGTPETAAADEEEEEPIPNLALGSSRVGSTAVEEEEIAFDGPNQLENQKEVPQEDHLSKESDKSVNEDSIPSPLSQQIAPPQPSLANSLISRADKSEPTEDLLHRSPAASIATSVYNSREPSVNNLDLSEPEDEPLLDEPQPTKPFLKLPMTQSSTFTTSPTYSQTSSLPGDLSSPTYSQGLRYLRNDPASEYPSPPSSPATSVQGSLAHVDNTPHLVNDDVSVYSVEREAKPSSNETEFIEQASHPSSEEAETLSASIIRQPELEPTIPIESSVSSSERPSTPTPYESVAAPLSSPSPSTISTSAASPYFDRTTTATPRRSRFSYQGLGLRMPSSIAPKLATEDESLSQTETSGPPTSPSLARSTSARKLPREEVIKPIQNKEPSSSTSNPPLFPGVQPTQQHSESREKFLQQTQPTTSTLDVSGYQDETFYPSSPSAYAPSSVASTPEITQAYRVPITSPSMLPVVSAFPEVASQVKTPSPLPQETTPPVATELSVASEPPISVPPPSASISVNPAQDVTTDSPPVGEKKEEEESSDPNQLSTVGVAVDIGTAVAGALVMGGLAVGQSALRGLAVGWSAWRGASNQSVIQETKVLEVSNVVEPVREEEEQKEFKSYARVKDVAEENEGSRKAESSVISTEWGEAEFDAPEGFLEEFKRAMAEIGEEDLAANEQAQIDAQLAAYQSASRQHVDAVSSPALSDNSSLASSTSSSPMAFPSSRSNRQRESSALRPQPETIEEDSADEYERELEDLLAPVWDSPSRRSRISVDFPTRHGFAPPPGLTGSAMSSVSSSRPTSVISTSSISSLPNSPSLKSSPSSPRQPAKLSKTSKSILGFGRSKSTKNLSAKPSSRTVPPSTSLPGLSGSKSSSSLLSRETSRTTTINDSQSQHSKTSSHKTAGKRSSSIFNFGGGGGKEVPPVPNIESQIKDTTYISYGTSKPQRRNSNTSSISTGLYASRDPYLIAPTPGTVIPPLSNNNNNYSPSSSNGRNRERTVSSSINSDSLRSSTREDPGGAPLSRRRSSLRATSAYDGGSQLTRSSSIVEGEKKLYRVRFGNAVGGIGLRSVADSEAEKAGGDRYGQRWVGVGRGRYGNMIIKTDEESDMVYAEQVAQIKKKWRAFGSEQSRDWAAVRIDK